tara:strand:+ start:588 stop:794 length:207 start_codon:yes stop_codon:yes gene_type:complete
MNNKKYFIIKYFCKKKNYSSNFIIMKIFGYTFNGIDKLVGPNIITGIGSDLLSTSIWFNAETKIKWFE